MKWDFPERKRWFIKIYYRNDFNKIVDWNLLEIINEDIEIDYSDKILIFDTLEDKDVVLNCIIMNHFKDFEDGEY